jgi:hypothetical protein
MTPIDATKPATQLTAEELQAIIKSAAPPTPKTILVQLEGITFGAVMMFWVYSIPALMLIGLIGSLATCALGVVGLGLGGRR